jgi:hypothetical protein
MKISNLVEQIFATAVALDQSGGLRNTIYALNNEVYIMNYDHTVLLRFRLRRSEGFFDHPISFKANDYDSNEFEEKDGRIVFYSGNDGYKKKKVCGTTDLTPEQVKELFSEYIQEDSQAQSYLLSKDILELMDDSLSHVEFIGDKKNPLKMIQRNIYSGGIIEIEKKSDGFFKETLINDFGPVAIKTQDFQALFQFQNQLKFSFPTNGQEDLIVIRSVNNDKRDMAGIIACCLYDEIIKIKEVEHGGQKQKVRRG